MKKWKVIFLIFLILVTVVNFVWLENDNSISGGDSQNHLLYSINYFYSFTEIIHNNSFSFFKKIASLFDLFSNPTEYGSLYWPNGLNAVASLCYLLLGKSLFVAKLSLFPFLIVLLVSTFWIGKIIHSDFVGFLSAFLVFAYPMIFQSSRQYQLDFPLTAMVTLSILFLIKCNYFKSYRYSIFLGISLGAGMLIKGQVVLFLMVPILYISYKIFRKYYRKGFLSFWHSAEIRNLMFFIIIVALIAFIWWGSKIEQACRELSYHVFSPFKALEVGKDWGQKYSIHSITFYFRNFFDSLGPFLFIIFLVSFLFFLFDRVRYKGIFLSWIISPFLLFSIFFTVKNSRFLMPLLPSFSIITAIEINRIKMKFWKNLIITVLMIFSIVEFYFLSYPSIRKRQFFTKIFGKTNYMRREHIMNYKIDEIYEVIKKRESLRKKIKICSIDAAKGKLSKLEIMYRLKLRSKYLKLFDITEQNVYLCENLEKLDYILISLPHKYCFKLNRWQECIEILSKNTKYFSEWKKCIKFLAKEKYIEFSGWEKAEEILLMKDKYKILCIKKGYPKGWKEIVKYMEENIGTKYKLISKIFTSNRKIVYFIFSTETKK